MKQEIQKMINIVGKAVKNLELKRIVRKFGDKEIGNDMREDFGEIYRSIQVLEIELLLERRIARKSEIARQL